jgi:hypothetical protein
MRLPRTSSICFSLKTQEVFAFEDDPSRDDPARRVHKAHYGVGRHCLARTALPDEPEDPPFPTVKVHIVDGPYDLFAGEKGGIETSYLEKCIILCIYHRWWTVPNGKFILII